MLNVSITPLQKETVMDPSTVYFLNEYYLIENLSSRLVEMDAKDGYRHMLASNITTENNIDYVITLKETYFSNGELITSTDVKKSFERAMGNRNSHIKISEIVKDITIKSKNELLITLFKPTNHFLYFLTLIDLSILHSSQYSKDALYATDWVEATSGAFSYSFGEDGEVFLLKNNHFKLTENNYADKIKLLSSRGRDSFEDFKKRKVDVGEFNLNSYDKNINNISQEKSLSIIGNTGDMINFLALNVNSQKFKLDYNRKWIMKKIINNFSVPSEYAQVARKAFEFFTPQVKGFLEENIIKEEVQKWTDINEAKVPDELKDGFVIYTYERAYEVTLEKIVKQMSAVLGIPVTIKNSISSPNFDDFIKKDKFDAFLSIASMDQIIVGESVNLHYFSSSPVFKDVNGKIKDLMEDYHYSKESSDQVVKKIAFQMLQDSECIPLFYVASPFFYNNDVVNIQNLDELTYFNFWKIKIR